MTINWSEVLGSDSEESGHSESLERAMPVGESSDEPSKRSPDARAVHKVALQFTLNHPRTQKFLNSSSHEQSKMYLKILFNVKNFNGMIPDEVKYVFEHCDSGQLHMHTQIKYSIPHEFHINGLVSDFSKNVLKQLPPKFSQYKEACLYHQYNRYRDKGLCVQYYTQDHPRVEFFGDEYMTKENTPQILK